MKNMKNKTFHKKISNLLNNIKKTHKNENGQMITLMGITMVVSVFAIASIPSQLSEIDVAISRERATSLLPEFLHLKEAFGTSLNYNLLTSIGFSGSDLETTFYGNISTITTAFEQTKTQFYTLELQHNVFFDAQLKSYQYSHTSPLFGIIYAVDVTLNLDDEKTSITDDVEYYIICNMEGP